MFCVSIMLTPTGLNPTSWGYHGSGATPDLSGPSNNSTTFYPYLVDPSDFPSAEPVQPTFESLSWSRLVTFTADGFTQQGLVYIETDSLGNNYLEFESGLYSPLLAQQMSTCSVNCTTTLPINWGSPTQIASLGGTTINGVAAASNGTNVAVAVGVGSETDVYVSFDLGVNNSWTTATGSSPLSGNNPGITFSPCGILVTTLTSSNLVVTTLPIDCQSYPSSNSSFESDGVLGPSGAVPNVTNVNPDYGSAGTDVMVLGTNFTTSSLAAKFERGTQSYSASITYEGPTEVSVTAPSGPTGGAPWNIVITDSGGTSSVTPADEFFYPSYPKPVVSGVSPSSSPTGTYVNISGADFMEGSAVKFGSNASATVEFETPDELVALAPWAVVGSKVNVRVSDPGGTSSTSSSDKFTYTLGTRPAITSVWPSGGPAGTRVEINGTGFTPTGTVYFGSAHGDSVTYVSPTEMKATSSSGAGTVNIIVNASGLASSANPYDLYSYPPALDTNFPRYTEDLPPASSAAPVWTTSVGGPNGTLGVFAALTGTSEFEFYGSTVVGASFVGSGLFPFNYSSGSPYFTTLGGTLLETPGGDPGQVAAVEEGGYFTAFVTDQEQNRTVLRSIGSSTAGATWGPAYLTGAALGSFGSLSASSSPAGYVYVAALDTSSGEREVDQAVFSPTGKPLLAPAPISQSTSSGLGPVASASVDVDPLQQPLYAWSQENFATNVSAVEMTGALLSPTNSVAVLRSTFDTAPLDDFASVSNLGSFLASVDQNLSRVAANLTEGPSKVCAAERLFTAHVRSPIGPYPPVPVYTAATNCTLVFGSESSKVLAATGALNLNTSLAVLGEWVLEAFGYGVYAGPVWPGTPMTGSFTVSPVYRGGANIPVGEPAQAENSSWNDWILVRPQGISQNAVYLNFTPGFTPVGPRQVLTNETSGCGLEGLQTDQYGDVYSVRIGGYSENVSAGGFHADYSGKGPAGFYLADLAPNSTGTFYFNATVTFAESDLHIMCSQVSGTTAVNPVTLGPASLTLSCEGTWSTYFGLDPANVRAQIQKNGSGHFWVTSDWNNTLYGDGNATVTVPNHSARWEDSGAPVLNEAANISVVNATGTYTLYSNVTDLKGGYNTSWTPLLLAGTDTTQALPFTVTSTCTWSLSSASPPVTVSVPEEFQNNTTATSVSLIWYATSSNSSVSGWIRFHEAYGPLMEQTAVETHHQGDLYRFQVQLNGLTPWGLYDGEVGVTTGVSSCASFEGSAPVHFNTTADPQLAEYDLPYDSITQEGGGAIVYFQVPGNVLEFGGDFSVYVTYHNTSVSGNVTDLNLTADEFSLKAATVSFNLSALVPNNVYDLVVDFNYTYGGSYLTAQNSTFSFWYLKDTSGDGLTDSEKVQGWDVTTRSLDGAYTNQHVTANPDDYATNGLVNDFLEKELGLNPRVLDSAGSHMLDTWNLTFDLGPAGSSFLYGGVFHYWLENDTYNFSRVAQYPGGPVNFAPARDEPNDVNDSYAVSSETLWSGTGAFSALQYFLRLAGRDNVSWLRAVTGEYNAGYGLNRTITIVGKLSWGADPLAQSSTMNGYLDGDTVDPLGTPFVQLTVDHWNTTAGLSSGDGVAPYLEAHSGIGSGLVTDYRAWGPNETSSGGPVSYPGPFSVTFPVVPTYQNASINLSLDYQPSGSLTTVLAVPSVSVDLLQPMGEVWYNTTSGEVHLSYRVLYDPGRATTYLLTPLNNTTLSNAPWGLRQYTAEQDFDLLVLNDNSTTGGSATTEVASGIPGDVGSWQYSVTLQPGLNNLLVPRSLFLASPLGQTLINGSAVNPLVDFPGTSFAASDWFDRVNQSTTSNTSSNFIRVFSNPDQGYNVSNAGADGGVASNGNLEYNRSSGTNLESLQVQAVFYLNITNSGNGQFANGSLELSNLIGGLIQNTSGNLTANFVDVTTELGTMGLSSNVLTALANASYANGGAFGAPQYSGSSSGGGSLWSSLGSAICNAVSGVAYATGIGQLVSAVWSAASAALAYAATVGAAIAHKLGLDKIADQIGSALKAIGEAMWNALRALASFIGWLIDQLLTPIINPVKNAISSYATELGAEIASAWGDVNASEPAPASVVDGFWSALSGGPFWIALGIGVTIEAALLLTSEFGFATDFVVVAFTSLIGVALGLLPGMPSFDVFGQAAATTLQTFLGGLDPVPPIYVDPSLATTFGVSAIGTDVLASGIAGWMVFQGFKTLFGGGGVAEVALAGPLFALTVVTMLLDSIGLIDNNPGLTFAAMILGLLDATVAGVFIHEAADPANPPTLGEYGTVAFLCGGGSVAYDIGYLAGE